MTYRIAIWRLCFSRTLFLARAAAKASSWNGFGLSVDFARPLQVLVRVWGTCAMACPMARWHVKLRQEGATPWASGALAANVSSAYAVELANTNLTMKHTKNIFKCEGKGLN